jgi:hypothetical protein
MRRYVLVGPPRLSHHGRRQLVAEVMAANVEQAIRLFNENPAVAELKVVVPAGSDRWLPVGYEIQTRKPLAKPKGITLGPQAEALLVEARETIRAQAETIGTLTAERNEARAELDEARAARKRIIDRYTLTGCYTVDDWNVYAAACKTLGLIPLEDPCACQVLAAVREGRCMWHFVNCTSSPEPGAESSADSFSAMCQSAPLNWRNTLGLSSSSGSGTASSPGSPCGTTFGPSTATPGEATLISSPEASPARTSAPLVEAKESTVPAPASGGSLHGSFARFDPATSSWRTPHCSLLGDSVPFSGTWPRWGSLRNGACWARTMPVLRTSESGSGFWPTPTATSYGTNQGGSAGRTGRTRPSLQTMASKALWPTPTAVTDTGGAALCKWGGSGARAKLRTMVTPAELNGPLNPEWVEWLMGWPRGWTDLGPLNPQTFRALRAASLAVLDASRPSATAKSHSALRSHGACCPSGSEEDVPHAC